MIYTPAVLCLVIILLCVRLRKVTSENKDKSAVDKNYINALEDRIKLCRTLVLNITKDMHPTEISDFVKKHDNTLEKISPLLGINILLQSIKRAEELRKKALEL